MCSLERQYALYNAVRHIIRKSIPGDFVECGVWRGGSAMLAALTCQALGDKQRHFTLFDTFGEFPKPSAQDDEAAWHAWTSVASSAKLAGAQIPTISEVRTNMLSTGLDAERLTLVQGRVEETIPSEAPDQISLLRLDTDWYESTAHELQHLYPRLASGGILIIDDYGAFRGARQATDEFLATLDAPPMLTRIDNTGRIAVKPG